MEAELKAALAAFLGPRLKYIEGVERIAGYQGQKDERKGFDAFHKFITDPTPAFITNWRSNEKDEQRYYSRLVGGVLHHTYQAYLAVNYHYEKLVEIENALLKLFGEYDLSTIPYGVSEAMGSTPKWDFEYQAFVLSYRRCLDYFTYALNAYFKDGANSFREWGKHLARHKPAVVAAAILEVYSRHRDEFHFVMNVDPKIKSVRDRITHNESVGAGYINLTREGIFIVGGGEKLGISGQESRKNLSTALSERIENLNKYLNESLFAWIESVNPDELR